MIGSTNPRHRRHARVRRLAGLGAALAAAVAAAPASAASVAAVSSNWSGYVVRGSGVAYRHVSGSWVAPPVSCSAGSPSYSAFWLGLGGYQSNSPSLEQVGTEADCSASGRARYSIWYELVPSAVTLRMKVTPGDTISASVGVTGHNVQLRLRNLTRGTSFSKRLRMAAPDLTSAEWIAEAPIVCDRGCALPALANFGTTLFTNAAATSTVGHTGPISDPRWSSTAISLGPGGHRRGRLSASSGGAVPSPVAAAGNAFTIAWQSASADPNAFPNGG